jgi:serine/threonine protein kinase
MPDLVKGFSFKTKGYKTVTVKAKLGEGGQGAVYRVDYNGAEKALKWYNGSMRNPKRFYDNLENNIKKGPPTSAFLWPEDISDFNDKNPGSFGYIMNLRPAEYIEFSQYLIARAQFASVNAMVNAALKIIEGFRELHLKGYTYQDLNDGNFFINPKNGDVLICDNDNVSEYGKNSGIAGKARYMAPEIVLNKAQPNKDTDRFSLAVALFLLFTGNHPLEGKNACPPCMSAKHERRIFGESPVFIFDPVDKSNTPVPGLHRGAIAKWPYLPVYLQGEFIKAFSREIMLTDPSKRIMELDWLHIFIRMKGEIYKCPCGEVYFADPVTPNACPECGKRAAFSGYIKAGRYYLPLHQRTRLYACHTEKDSEDFETITAQADEKGGVYELKNASQKKWTAAEKGSTKTIENGETVILEKGLTLNFPGGQTAEVL